MPLWQKCRGCNYLGPDFKDHFKDVHVKRLVPLEKVLTNANKYMRIIFTGESQSQESQSQISFRCSSCSAICSSSKSFIDHIEGNHLQQKPFKCGVCADVFKTENDLCEHGHNVHWETMVKETPVEAGSTSSKAFSLKEKRVHLNQCDDVAKNLDTENESKEIGGEVDIDFSKSPLKTLKAVAEKAIQEPIAKKTKTCERESRPKTDEEHCNEREDVKLTNKRVEMFLKNDDSKYEADKLTSNADNNEKLNNSSDGIHSKNQSHDNDSLALNSSSLDSRKVSCDYPMEEVKDEVCEYPTVVQNKGLSHPKEVIERIIEGCGNKNASCETNEDDSVVRQFKISNDTIGGCLSEPAVECNECEVVLNDKYTLPSHIKRVHMKRSNSHTLVACPQCNYRHLSQDKMFMHINDVHYKKFKEDESDRQDLSALKHSVLIPSNESGASIPQLHESMPLSSGKKVTNKNEVLEPRDKENTPSYSLSGQESKFAVSKPMGFGCMFCKAEFVNIITLRKHVNQKHSVNACPSCFFKSTSSDELIRHYHTIHLELVACTLCESLLTQDEFKSHMQLKHAQCTECQLLFKSQEDLKRHNFDNHQFQCGLCDEVLFTKDKLQNHMNVVHSCIRPPASRSGMMKNTDIIQANLNESLEQLVGETEEDGERIASSIPQKYIESGRPHEQGHDEYEQASASNYSRAEFPSSQIRNRGGRSKRSRNQNVDGTKVGRKQYTRKNKKNSFVDEPTYCKCSRGQGKGRMIACDDDSCPIEWFHFKCVGVTSKPKGEWYCPDCRGDKASLMRPEAKIRLRKERSVSETAEGMENQSEEVEKGIGQLEKKGEEGLSTMREEPISDEQGCANSNSTKACFEEGKKDSKSDGVKRGRGRPPKNPQQQPSSSVPNSSSSGEETKQTTFLQPSQTDDPQSTADSNTEIPKKTGRYSCASCDYVTPSRTLLRKHAAANHSSEKTAAKAECGQCGYKGRNDVVLRIHYRQMHPDN